MFVKEWRFGVKRLKKFNLSLLDNGVEGVGGKREYAI